MRPRPKSADDQALTFPVKRTVTPLKLGLVLSGGGSRAAYQAGALKALIPYLEKHPDKISIVIGSSIGSVNGLVFAACMEQGLEHAATQLQKLWRTRTFKNTFAGSPSTAFLRAMKMAFLQYMSPGPGPTQDAIFDPSPLMQEVDEVLRRHGGLHPKNRLPSIESVGVMTTVEGTERKPLLFLSSHKEISPEYLTGASFELYQVEELTARHGFASAALPSVLPPVEIDDRDGNTFRLVDGGISQNVPVDPAVRLGAERVIIIDISGRAFWLDQYNEAHDSRPSWEVPAGLATFCMRPPETFVIRNQQPFGPILKEAVGRSTRKFLQALGPTWPVFRLLKNRLGEELAYEVMTYVALDPDYIHGLIERGYQEAKAMLKQHHALHFKQHETLEELVAVSSE
ncbi:patatin-like phospholipase family protein [bacterium]|nr:patatin-like phospholipase family protein [bacterium]